MFGATVLFLLSVKCAICANILFISPLASPSHHIWNRALAYGLVNQRHNVTLLGPDTDQIVPQNYTHLHLTGMYEAFQDEFDINNFPTLNPLQTMLDMTQFSVIMCEILLKSNATKKLLEYPEDFFDAILIDVTATFCPLGFKHRFKNALVIAVTAFLLPSYVAHSYGNPLVPSYVPWHSMQYTSQMNFIERVWNFLFAYAELLVKTFVQYPKEYRLARTVFGDDMPYLQELERRVVLVLTNTDPVLDVPQPLAPNFIPVGGLHTRKSQKLPKDLQAILDDAKNGAIIFSLGSNLRSDKLQNTTQKALIDAFKTLQETVIWKFESEIKDLPKNIIIRKWLPQNDILGHPNVKLFIGHGGALSTQEAIFHGVPLICIPFFADQHLNAKNVVNRKLGLSFDVSTMTTNSILDGLREILNNPIYIENMRQISQRFNDEPKTPLQRAIFWVEYVMRHGGDFLSTPSRDMSLYVSTGLDVVLFFSAICVAVIWIFLKFIRLIFNSMSTKEKIKIQ